MNYYDDTYLAHHGIKGMKWGIRRYQNEDGSLTDAGKKHYGMSGKHLFNLKTGFNINKDIKKMSRNVIRDTRKAAFSGKEKISRSEARMFGLPGQVARKASKFSPTGLKNQMATNKKIVSEHDKYMKEHYGEAYKKYKRKKIGKAVATTAALAAIGGAAIYGSARNRGYNNGTNESYRRKRAKANYAKTNATVERIQNNPNAVHIGNKYAKR